MNTNMPTEALENVATEDRVAALEEENRKLRQLAHEAERLRRENETMRTKKRLGLVWEQENLEEDAATIRQAILPRLIEEEDDSKVSSLDSNSGNLVIEGDNLDALRLLSKTHKGKVDCIFIDPPYNTGNTTWVYNDQFVNKDHRWRKSLWLEFIYQRLFIARDLLSERGVILAAINDEHRSLLELLMEEVMPGMRLGSMVWRTRDTTSAKAANFSDVHEHILVFAKPGFSFSGNEKSQAKYKNPDNDPRGPWNIDPLTLAFDRVERPNLYYPIQDPTTDIWYPCDPDRVWAYASKDRLKPGQKTRSLTMEEHVSESLIVFPEKQNVVVWTTIEEVLAAIDSGDVPVTPRDKKPLIRKDTNPEFWVGRKVGFGRPGLKKFWKDLRSHISPLGSWIARINEDEVEEVCTLRTGSGGEGTNEIQAIFGRKAFPNPKPLGLVKQLVSQSTSQDSIVLDFFAGSGTTAEAVLRINQEDGGKRRFIMVSSTEANDKEPHKNVCRDVCAQRIKAACVGYGSGKKRAPGSGDGFAYLRLEKLPPHHLEDALTDDLVWSLLQIHHDRPVTTFSPTEGVMLDDGGETAIALCPTITEEVIETLRNATPKSMILYTEYPGYAAEKLAGCAIEARPAYDTAIRIAKQ